jgi:hypothetical protein
VNNHISTYVKLLRKIASADDVNDNIPSILFSFDLGDVILIGSASDNQRTAELAAKNAALLTIRSHDKQR